MRLIQVSDTHLSATHTYFAMNWAAFAADIAAKKPDVIVHTGDIAFNAPAAPADLAYGRAAMDALRTPWRAIAGNHDVGEAPAFSRLNQYITDETRAAWRTHIGPHWWKHDFSNWRLIGLDTALMGSDLPAEAAQTEFFREALAARDRRPVMVFVHMPPYDDTPEDPKWTTAVMPYGPRMEFLDLCAAGGVKIIACGHAHLYRQQRYRDMRIVWAPATAMVDFRRTRLRTGRVARAGYLEWMFIGLEAIHTLVTPPRMFSIDMTGWTSVNGGTVTNLPPYP